MADNVSVIIRGTLLQTLTPQHLLGRVSSVNQIFIGSSNEIGAFESGVAARLLGTVPSVIFGGVMTLIVVALTMAWAPQLRKMREIDESKAFNTRHRGHRENSLYLCVSVVQCLYEHRLHHLRVRDEIPERQLRQRVHLGRSEAELLDRQIVREMREAADGRLHIGRQQLDPVRHRVL